MLTPLSSLENGSHRPSYRLLLTSLICVLPLVAGCSLKWRTRVDVGHGQPFAFGDLLNKASGLPVDINYGSLKIGPELYANDYLSLDLMIGGWIADPTEHQSSTAYGAVASPRILFKASEAVQPYFVVDLGLGRASWEPQGTSFNFLVGGGPGVAFPITDNARATISYQLFHISNAGIKKDNPGLNSDLIVVGFELEF